MYTFVLFLTFPIYDTSQSCTLKLLMKHNNETVNPMAFLFIGIWHKIHHYKCVT